MERFENISGTIYDLIEDITEDKIAVRDKTSALNSLYLLRDSLIDLRYAHSLVKQLAEKRIELMEQQVEKEDFSGELHEAYHEASGQLRAITISILQLGKRTLNNSSYVLASFLPHGVPIKEGSFGKQCKSAQAIELKKLDKRSKALIKNLLGKGSKLELHNDARDIYVEHVKPATKAQQRRPVHTGEGVNYMKEKPEFAGIQERLYGGMVRTALVDYVVMGEKDKDGNEILTYHVHIGHGLVSIGKNMFRSAFMTRPPEYDPDHFKKLEPHSHSFTKSENDDTGNAGTDHSIEITEMASAEEMIADYCDYIENLLAALRVT